MLEGAGNRSLAVGRGKGNFENGEVEQPKPQAFHMPRPHPVSWPEGDCWHCGAIWPCAQGQLTSVGSLFEEGGAGNQLFQKEQEKGLLHYRKKERERDCFTGKGQQAQS
ncbi:hypothetical protein Y1Q_0018773 [Alligator mississippiensis]|uniref:Uncharacterized protein n=1 Tax=Alligator mississippiensis TaxID=8496 RepID=A0A151NSS1_ALLMI|nr:hypothetical protein Y1Q_0018773 [Alligator mississippiensis]